MSKQLIVVGCGTDVGKTVVSAILMEMLEADYWKPVQCGEADSEIVRGLVALKQNCIYPSVYTLKASLSPHHAARLENIEIKPHLLCPPISSRHLIIELAGGVLVPLTVDIAYIDIVKKWSAPCVVVSKNYLGSINHTLLTIEALKQRGIAVHSIIFNGIPNPDSEEAILRISQLPSYVRMLPEQTIDQITIQRYAKEWKQHFVTNPF